MTLLAFSWELFLLGSHVSLISSRLRSQFVKLSHTTLNYVSSNDSLVLLQNVFLCCETSYSSHFLMWIQHHPLLMDWGLTSISIVISKVSYMQTAHMLLMDLSRI